MKQILTLILLCCQLLPVMAQKQKAPKWMNKGKKAVVMVTTYGKDGMKLTSGMGVFVSETGDLLTTYELFKGAERATVTDVDGKVYPISRIVGADELYDVIKVRVEGVKKLAYLPIATNPMGVGTPAYLLPYTPGKEVTFSQGTVTEVSKLKDNYSYYQLTIPLESSQVSAPMLTAEGAVFGLAQVDASGKKEISYAVEAGYVNSLAMSSTDFLSSVYTAIGIQKAWPQDVEQAQASLFLMGSMQDAKTYLATLNDFIATFPNVADGYLSRANHYAANRANLASTPAEQANYLEMALSDIDKASDFSNNKAETYYNKAKLIYGVAMVDTTMTDPTWTLQTALETIQKAIAEDNQPHYHQLAGDIYFSQKAFQQAYDEYMLVNESDMASPVSFYWAAKAKENISGFMIGDVIALLDKAIEKSGLPLTAEAAPYILERIDWKTRLSLFAEAVADYELYYRAMKGVVGADFFFYREQARLRANDLQGALVDINEAIRLTPNSPDYLAEKASVCIRLKNYTEAIAAADAALKIAPDFAACHRLKGFAYIRMNNKADALTALTKAKELGDPMAEKMIEEHCK